MSKATERIERLLAMQSKPLEQQLTDKLNEVVLLLGDNES